MIVNKRGLADVFGVSEETINGWQRDGMPVQLVRMGAKGSEYNTAACIQWRIQRGDRRGGASESIDYHEERARLTKAQADQAEMKAAVERGELCPLDELIAHWTDRAIAFKSKLFAMPGKITPQLRVARTDAEAAELLEQEIQEALTEIEGDGVPDSVRARQARFARSAKATAKTDGQPVG